MIRHGPTPPFLSKQTSMKNREDVLALFRDKYDYLKSVYQQVGAFDEARVHQNPDDGWEVDLENAAITLRPGDDDPHETHGAIFASWRHAGGAFNGVTRGWLGYPITDEKQEDQYVEPPCPPFLRYWEPPGICVPGAVSEFEYGIIRWHDELPWDRANETHAYDHVGSRLRMQAVDDFDNFGGDDYDWLDRTLDDVKSLEEHEKQSKADPRSFFPPQNGPAVSQGTRLELNQRGKGYVPDDIDKAVYGIINRHGFHPVSEKTRKDCFLTNQEGVRPAWTFRMTARNEDQFEVTLWHDSSYAVCGRYQHTPRPPNSWKEKIFPRGMSDGPIFIPASELA